MFARMSVPAFCVMAFASAAASEALSNPVGSTAEVEGVWQPPNNTAQFKVQLDLTKSGGILAISRLTKRCTYVLRSKSANGAFESFPIKGRGCDAGVTTIQTTADGLRMALPETWDVSALTLIQLSGPDNSQRLYPQVAIRGVTLGASPNSAKQALRGAGYATKANGRSERVLRNVKGLRGTYIQASTSYDGDFGGTSAVEDVLGLLQVEGDANGGIAAILRHWAPAPQNAPTADAFVEALVETYGQPIDSGQQGRRTDMTWYYGLDGTIAKGASLRACKQRPGRAHRVAAILFDELEFFASTGRARLEATSHRADLHPQSGCGYTLHYVVRRNDDGSLLDAEASFYDHRAVANQIWKEGGAGKARLSSGYSA